VSEWWPVVVTIGTAVALRLLDALLPKDHHVKWVDRFLTHDHKPEDEDADDET
jgi:hypothetical protein